MFFGSLYLFNSPDPALRTSLQVIIPIVLTTAAFFAIGAWLSLRTLGKKPVSGASGLIGQEGDARTPRPTRMAGGCSWPARTGRRFRTRRYPMAPRSASSRSRG